MTSFKERSFWFQVKSTTALREKTRRVLVRESLIEQFDTGPTFKVEIKESDLIKSDPNETINWLLSLLAFEGVHEVEIERLP